MNFEFFQNKTYIFKKDINIFLSFFHKDIKMASWWVYLITFIYVLYAVLFIRLIHNFFSYRLPVFDRIEKIHGLKY